MNPREMAMQAMYENITRRSPDLFVQSPDLYGFQYIPDEAPEGTRGLNPGDWSKQTSTVPELTPLIQKFYKGLPQQVDQVIPKSRQEDLILQEEMRQIMEQAHQEMQGQRQAMNPRQIAMQGYS